MNSEAYAAVQGAIDRAQQLLWSQQTPQGYWWYTLEANETIGAEYIFLEHCLDRRTPQLWERLALRMLQTQAPDGSWNLAYGQPGDLSTTIECYVALRMAGYATNHASMRLAREFIVQHGGIAQARVFTKIHFALLDIVDWSEPPSMPIETVLLPHWLPFSIYEFSSWARACIVPLMVVMSRKPTRTLPPGIDIQAELHVEERSHNDRSKGDDPWATFFYQVDAVLKQLRRFGRLRPAKAKATEAAEAWIREHVAETEDIFPALSYSALALHALGYPLDDPTLTKALAGLQKFQQSYQEAELPALPFTRSEAALYEVSRVSPVVDEAVHQQCCISPVWDTPWAMCALSASGAASNDARLVKAAEWLLSKQITTRRGDWERKNPQGEPGGWSFEFENSYFPDIDDTIQVLFALQQADCNEEQLRTAERKALAWCLSMQNDDGGWAAFDKNNSLAIVNKIPFSDHGACLDPSSPDISGRMLELLARYGYTLDDAPVQRVVRYLLSTQEEDGSWFGRWGVNYLYGTWAAVKGLRALGFSDDDPSIVRARDWLESVQHADGGFGESVDSYPAEAFVAAPSCPSQTAWGLMAMLACAADHSQCERAAQYLVGEQNACGGWDEDAYTGTGFPGHFYIRYHGYRHYFPLLALANFAAHSCKDSAE